MVDNLAGYWWILPPLLYLILFVAIIRCGLWDKVGRKILLAAICLFILLIPSSRWLDGYPFAALTVINLLLFVVMENRQAKVPSKLSDE